MEKSSGDCKTVCIIGGGIAGLAAAVFLTYEGFKVKLIESSPKLGGRAYSFFDKSINANLDNGQHIFASWYSDTFEYLKIICSYDKLEFQKSLEIDFVNLKGESFKLKTSQLKSPFNLLYGLMTYKAISLKDRLGVIKLMKWIKKVHITEADLKKMNTEELFSLSGQSNGIINSFWKPFIIAVFNAIPKDTSAYMFTEMIKLGFLTEGNSELVLPHDFLSKLYVEPSEKYLADNDAEVLKSTPVKKMNFENDKVDSVELQNGENIRSDFYLSTVPFFDFKNLVGNEIYEAEFKQIDKLRYSPIINVHINFKSKIDTILRSKFVGVLEGTIQWIFKVTDNQICIVISSAKELAAKDKDEIINLCKEELYKCLPEFKSVEIEGTRVIKETRATFIPDIESLDARPGNRTRYKNFFIAGDWTDTGLPSTIEGAIRSSKNCIKYIKESLN